jgi:HTH-like domain
VVAPLLAGGGRSDEHRHLDLHRPPLRCRPGLSGVGAGARRPVSQPPRGYRALRATAQAAGPQGPIPDAALVEAIRQVLTDSPFHGEGYRKVWARLRHQGLRTSKERVRRLMRENGLSATTRMGRPRGPRNHDGTIIPEAVDTMWDEPSSRHRFEADGE